MASLNPKQSRFVAEYLIDLNATQAAIRAGYSKDTAKEQGSRLLTNVHVKAQIEEATRERAVRTEVTQDMVLKELWAIASADPNELIQYRRTCCRFCYGEGFQYQRTAQEWVNAQAQDDKQPDPMGGTGYDATKGPNPNCPQCFGEGVGNVFAPDSRNLSDAARSLYAGAKKTRDGFEIKMHSKLDALTQVGRYLGMFKDNVDHTSGGQPMKALIGIGLDEF